MLNDLYCRIRALVKRNAVEAELNEELRYHLDRHVEKLMHTGMSRTDATRQAHLSLGGLEQTKEECREARGVMIVEALGQDIAYAIRVLRRSPGFSAAVTLSIALGIGANTALFSLIDAVMWRPLPVRDPQGLVVLAHGQGSAFDGGFTYGQYRLMRDQNRVLADLASYAPARLNVNIDGAFEPTAEGQLVSGNFFRTLGVHPVIGRAIGPEDDRIPNGHAVAMIGYGYWNRRFGRSPSVLGSAISISGKPFTIVGVAPREFFGAEVGVSPDLFLPVAMQPTVMPAFENLLESTMYKTWLQAIGRLKPGVQPQQAAADLEALFRQEIPKGRKFASLADERLVLRPGAVGLSSLRPQFSKPLFVLMGIVGIVLLIACANTANMLLARAAARRPEFAMRVALGAERRRLIAQVLTESVVLALLGGACGILLARWATKAFLALMSSGRSPIVLDLNPDLRVLLFTAGVSLATGIIFGLAPAIRATRADLPPLLKEAAAARMRSGSGLRLGRILVVVQVALSLVLLIGAGLFVRTLQGLSRQDAAFEKEKLLVVQVEPVGSDQRGVPGTSERLDRIYRELQRRVEAIPGVRSAGMAQFTPTLTRGLSAPLELPTGEERRAFVPMVYPGYFETVGISMLAGRDFIAADLSTNSPPVAVVNETLARLVFGNGNAVGQQFRIGGRLREVVGVVADSRYVNLRGRAPAMVYQPFLQTQTGRGQMALYVRVAGDSGVVLPHLRQAVQNLDKEMPLFEVRTLAEEFDAVLINERLIAVLSSFFAGLALVLACVGLYGLFSYAVVQRSGEMGIRIALGAKRGDIVGLMMREALLLVLIGVAVGVPAALGVSQIAASQISGLLHGIQSTDPFTISASVLFLVFAAALAGYVPARRAAHTDPMVTLRNE